MCLFPGSKMRPMLLGLLFPCIVSAQVINGSAVDEKGVGVPYVNILMLNPGDSSLVRGAVSDAQGNYVLENFLPGSYLITAMMVGYKVTNPAQVQPKGSEHITLPAFVLAEDVTQLQEVSVVAARPFIVQEIDGTVVNVANSVVSSGRTALEALEKAPGVIVDNQNNNLSLRGKEGVIVYLNGKPTYMAISDVVSMLRNTPSDQVDQIELITNPSAKYDAAGNAGIINIKLKKDESMGTNGSLTLSLGSGEHDREQASVTLNQRTKKLALFGSYGFIHRGNYWDFDLYRDWTENNERNVVKNISHIVVDHAGHNARAGADLFLGKNTTVGVAWSGQWTYEDEKAPADVAFRHSEDEPVHLATHSLKRLSTDNNNQYVNFNIQHTLGSHGGTINVDVDFAKYLREFTNGLLTSTLVPEENGEPLQALQTEMPSEITIKALKLDYDRQMNEHWKLTAGVKGSEVKSDNNMMLWSGDADDPLYDSTLSNHFLYEEQILAGFLNFSGRLGPKTEIQFGLRAEHTRSDAYSVGQANQVKRDYLNFFPSGFLSQNIAPNHNVTVSYSYRIDRPNYQLLNPARSYLDPYAFSRGNPFLQPQYTHSFELKHGFKESIYTSIGVSHTRDLFFYLVQPVSETQAERTPDNVGTNQSYNITVSFPLTLFPNWTLQTSFTGIYANYKFEYLDNSLSARQVSGRLNGSSAFIFGKGWTLEASYKLSTPAVNVIWRSPWLGSLDLGVQKVLSNKWKARLSVSDIFHTDQIIGYIEAAGFYQDVRIEMDTRVVMFTLTHSFGNDKLRGTRNRRSGSEEELRRSN